MRYDEPGTYEINLTATDDCGNTTTATRTVVVEEERDIIVDEDIITEIPQSTGIILTQLKNVQEGDNLRVTLSAPIVLIDERSSEYVANEDFTFTTQVVMQPYLLAEYLVQYGEMPTTPSWEPSFGVFCIVLDYFNENLQLNIVDEEIARYNIQGSRATHILVERI